VSGDDGERRPVGRGELSGSRVARLRRLHADDDVQGMKRKERQRLGREGIRVAHECLEFRARRAARALPLGQDGRGIDAARVVAPEHHAPGVGGADARRRCLRSRRRLREERGRATGNDGRGAAPEEFAARYRELLAACVDMPPAHDIVVVIVAGTHGRHQSNVRVSLTLPEGAMKPVERAHCLCRADGERR